MLSVYDNGQEYKLPEDMDTKALFHYNICYTMSWSASY